jgi:hypothetical protein
MSRSTGRCARRAALPFVTIFSCWKSLLADSEVTAVDRDNIAKLAKAENIDLTAADRDVASRLYNVVPVNGDL